jgi:O-antigen/teichoic acid export membrane protein
MLKLFDNLHFYLIQSLVSALISMSVISIAAKNIDIPSLGGYMLSYSYSLIVNSIINFGTIAVYDRNFFEYDSSTQKEEQNLLIRTLLIFNLTVLLISISIFILIPSIYYSVINLNKYSYVFVFLGTGFNFMGQLLLSRFKNLGEAKKFMIFGLIFPILYLVIFLFILKLEINYLKIEISYLLAQLFSLVILLLSISYSKGNKLFDLAILIYSLKIALPSLPRTLVGSLNNQMDRIFAGGIGGPSVLALYGIAQLVSSSIFIFMSALGREFQPKVYKIIFSDYRFDLAKMLNPYLYLCGLFSLVICLFSSEILIIFFGEDYVSVSSIVTLLSIVYLAMFIGKINGLQLLASRKTFLTSIASVFSILVNYSLISPFYEFFSIFGLALAFFISQLFFIWVCYYFSQVHRPLLVSLKFYFMLLFGHTIIFILIHFSYNFNEQLFLFSKILIIVIYSCYGIFYYFSEQKK